MKETTLGYIEHEGCYLMLLRNKKANDPNEGKWIGVGGHLEEGETADECFVREVMEETGIRITDFECRGVIDFISDTWESERMYLYLARTETCEVRECDEGTLRWISKSDVTGLNLWEGDRLFLRKLIDGEKDINMTLCYEGDILTEASCGPEVIYRNVCL